MYDIVDLNNKLVADLRQIAQKLEIKGYKDLKKQDLIHKILEESQQPTGPESSPVETVSEPAAPAGNNDPEMTEETQRDPRADSSRHKRPRRPASGRQQEAGADYSLESEEKTAAPGQNPKQETASFVDMLPQNLKPKETKDAKESPGGPPARVPGRGRRRKARPPRRQKRRRTRRRRTRRRRQKRRRQKRRRAGRQSPAGRTANFGQQQTR